MCGMGHACGVSVLDRSVFLKGAGPSQVSIVGFAVGGAFLTLVHFDLPYYLVAFVVLVEATMRESGRLVPRNPPPADSAA